MTRITPLLLVLFVTSPLLAADEHDTIVIALKREWQPTELGMSGVKIAVNASMSLKGQFVRFTSDEPGSRASFGYSFDLPIEMTQHPLLKLKYRAKNLATDNNYTCIWIIEGNSPAVFPLIDFNKLTVDGDIHEITIDLPRAPVDSRGTPFENGPVKGLIASLMNTEAGEGSLELISAEFESPTDPPAPVEKEPAITVHVVDDSGKPIAQAQLSLDSERLATAVAGTTDAQGQAQLTPVKNELDKHSLHVEAPEQAPLDMVLTEPINSPVEVAMTKAMQLGGFVQDEQGKPIANARVRVYARPSNPPSDRSIRMRYIVYARTDNQGQWLTEPLPWTDQIFLMVEHRDYQSDTGFRPDRADKDELRSGIATIVLKK